MINNRQNGRRRGRGGQQQRPQNGQGSRDSGNRIDSRARGNASQLYEKYKNMASDAQRQGDRVNTEYYLQFADHYFRVMADQRGRYEDQQPRRQQNDFDADEEYGDEGEPIRAEEQARGGDERAERDGNRQQYDGNRQQEGRQRSDREDRQQDGRSYDGNRQEGRQRNDRDDNRQRSDRDEGRQQRAENDDQRQEGRQRYNTPRSNASRRDERSNGPVNGEQPQAAVPQPVAAPVEAAPSEQPAEAAPKRRGRPRKTPVENNGVEGGEQLGLDTSILPPSIGAAPAAAPVSEPIEEAPKPRRRRAAAASAEVTTAN